MLMCFPLANTLTHVLYLVGGYGVSHTDPFTGYEIVCAGIGDFLLKMWGFVNLVIVKLYLYIYYTHNFYSDSGVRSPSSEQLKSLDLFIYLFFDLKNYIKLTESEHNWLIASSALFLNTIFNVLQ